MDRKGENLREEHKFSRTKVEKGKRTEGQKDRIKTRRTRKDGQKDRGVKCNRTKGERRTGQDTTEQG